MKSIPAFLLLLLLVRAMPGQLQAQHRAIARQLEQVMDTAFTTDPYNGVILLADKGRVVYKKAFGYRDVETGASLKAGDLFELASVSKQFTAMVIMRLEAEGKLRYDDPVEQYLEIPYKGITIRHLLNHTSGLPDYQEVMDRYWDKSRAAGNEDILEYLRKYAPPMLFAPGEKYAYSNTGYVLLASIAEKASGKDFHELLRKGIFQRWEMTHTDLRTPQEKKSIARLAYGHMKSADGSRYMKADSFPSSNYTIWLGNRKGPGRISSTAADLLRWDRALNDESFLTPAMKKEAFAPATLNDGSLSPYGFGWELDQAADGTLIVQHSGDNPGYKTWISRYLRQEKVIILLCNNSNEGIDRLLHGIRQFFFL